MSQGMITKKAIAAALKTLMKKKSFDKISVGEITEECGLNRQTFYYHFQDKFELLSWILYQETFLPIMSGISFANWNERLFRLFDRMKNEKYFYVNAINHASDYFQEYLLKISETILDQAIEVMDTELKLEMENREVIVRFFAYGVCGTVTNWATSGMKMEPKELANHMKELALSVEQAAKKSLYSQAVMQAQEKETAKRENIPDKQTRREK